MRYKNAELYNVAEIINNEDGSISWKRVLSSVHSALESGQGKCMAVCAQVLRFDLF